MELLRAPPDTSSFVPLAEHQSRTPASFYSGPPVLHYHSERCKVVILERDLADAPALNALRGGEAVSSNGNGNGSGTTAAAVVTGTGTVNGSASESDRHRQAREGGEEREGEEEEERMDEGNEEEDKEVVIDGVDVWVTSEYAYFPLSTFQPKLWICELTTCLQEIPPLPPRDLRRRRHPLPVHLAARHPETASAGSFFSRRDRRR